jgi:hypothetical protein
MPAVPVVPVVAGAPVAPVAPKAPRDRPVSEEDPSAHATGIPGKWCLTVRLLLLNHVIPRSINSC